MAAILLPRQWQSFVDKIRSRLASDGLLDVLDSLPPPSSFEFHDTTIRDQNAVRLRLGLREQDDDTRATSWAYIMRTSPTQRWKGEHKPPVLIRDEQLGNDEMPRLFKRAATSLLRRADELLPPFRFLQFDSQDSMAHVRDTLCALVLYYALVNGLTETAIKWGKFESSFVLALEYIDDSANYQQWQKAQSGDARTVSSGRTRRRVRPLHVNNEKDVEAETDTDTSDDPFEGMVVHSVGSSIPVKPDSHIAKLIAALGERASFLDAIPSTAITFTRQQLFPTFSPVMMHLGKYNGYAVNVYLAQDPKLSTRVLAQDGDGELLRWKFTDLAGIDLVEPFDAIMCLSQDLGSRGNKIRYLVFYYYMLAEHVGLLDLSKVQISFQSMIPVLCATCRLWKEPSIGGNTTGPQQTDMSTNERPALETANESDGALNNTSNRLKSEEENRPLQTEESKSQAVETDLEQRFVIARAVSVLSISSDENQPARAEEKLKEEVSTPEKHKSKLFDAPAVIDICSDDETVLPGPIEQTVERTPDIRAARYPPRPTAVGYDSDELQWPGDAKRKRKRSPTPFINDGTEDDEDFMEADGNAWKKASLGVSGGKGASTH